MRSTLAWIVGRGGLLGARLTAAIERSTPAATIWDSSVPSFSWRDPLVLAEQFEQAASEFAHQARSGFHAWAVIWAAGAGVIGTTEDALEEETRTLELLLGLLDRHFGQTGPRCPGFVFLSSSAGGAYGECADQPITEESPCRPISPYGRNKLEQEALVRTWAESHPDADCLIGRIANLYGPGQALDKPQGLISHISRGIIWQSPVHIYVPMDTIRDYLYVDDCAEQIAACLRNWIDDPTTMSTQPAGRVKLFAAEQTTTVAQIVGTFGRLAFGRHTRIICAPSALGVQQPRRLEFRSLAAPDLCGLRRTPLLVGINNVHRHQLARFRRGQLAAP